MGISAFLTWNPGVAYTMIYLFIAFEVFYIWVHYSVDLACWNYIYKMIETKENSAPVVQTALESIFWLHFNLWNNSSITWKVNTLKLM